MGSETSPERNIRRVLMTPAWVDALKPEATTVEWRDAGRDGLSLRVGSSGKRTWYCRYVFRGKERRYKLGAFPAVKLAKAREEARRIMGVASGTDDPQVEREKQRIGETVAAVVKAWKADTKRGPAGRWKGGLEGGTGRSFLSHIGAFVEEFGKRRLAEVTPRDFERIVSAPVAAATRNHRLTVLRLLLGWAKRKALIETDATAGLERERETERSRTFTDDELRALIRGFDATRYGRAVRLLALTGLRREEVLGSRWPWLEGDVLTIPPEAEKAGRNRGEPRRVALSPTAVALLAEQREALFAEGIRSEFIFATTSGERPHVDALKPTLYRLRGRRANGLAISTRKHRFRKLEQAALPKDVTIHDVRRTVADALLNRLKVAPWVVDHVVLGHARPKLLRTYMPNLPLDEAREALTKWAETLEGILAAEPAPGAENEARG